MAEITTRYQFIVSMREEIYVDGVLADVNTGSYNSLDESSDGMGRFVIDKDLYEENADAIQEAENEGNTIMADEMTELQGNLKNKGVIENPDAQPFDPDTRDDNSDDDTDTDTEDDNDEDSGGSGHGNFRDPGGDDSEDN